MPVSISASVTFWNCGSQRPDRGGLLTYRSRIEGSRRNDNEMLLDLLRADRSELLGTVFYAVDPRETERLSQGAGSAAHHAVGKDSGHSRDYQWYR